MAIWLTAALLSATLWVHKVAGGSLLSIRVDGTVARGTIHWLVYLLALALRVLREQRVTLLQQHFVDALNLSLGYIVPRHLITTVTSTAMIAASTIEAGDAFESSVADERSSGLTRSLPRDTPGTSSRNTTGHKHEASLQEVMLQFWRILRRLSSIAG